jgi:hypothetical protein
VPILDVCNNHNRDSSAVLLIIFLFVALSSSATTFEALPMFAILGALLFSTAFSSVLAATVGGFDDGGNTRVSAMMVRPASHSPLSYSV